MKLIVLFFLFLFFNNINAQNSLKNDIGLKYNYIFFEGLKHKSLYNYDKAKEYYLDCVDLNKQESAAYYELALIFLYENSLDQSLFYIKKAVNINPKNESYLLIKAEVLQKQGKYTEASGVYSNLITKKPEKIAYYEGLYMCNIFSSNFAKAITILNKIEKKFGLTDDLKLKKIDLYIELGKITTAEKEIKRLLSENPNSLLFLNKQIDIFLIKGETEKAKKRLVKLLKKEEENTKALILLAEIYNKENKQEDFLKIFKKIISSKEIVVQTKIKYVLDYIYDNQEFLNNEKLISFIINELTLNYPENDLVYIVSADLIKKRSSIVNTKDSSLVYYLKAIEINKEKDMVWEEVIIQYYSLEEFTKMEEWSIRAKEIFPFRPEFFLYESIAKYNLKKYEEAIGVLSEGKDFIIENDFLLARFYSLLGDIYHDIKNDIKSDFYYEKSISKDSTNIYLLNNYSYYLSLRGFNLERALFLIKKAVKEAPNNPSFLDTYAWVLFKMNKLQESLTYINKALSFDKKNPTLLDHYGDILCSLKDFEKAHKAWQQAIEILNKQKKLEKEKITNINNKIFNNNCE